MPPPNATCANCGVSMYAAPGRLKKYKQVTCSVECKWELHGAPRVECDICGKKVYKSPRVLETNEHFFCSMDCYHTGLEQGIGKNPGLPESIVTCDHCEDERVRRKPLYRKPFRLQKNENSYCSQACAGKARSRRYAKLRRNKPHNCTCDECRTTFYRAPSLIAMSKKQFCLAGCRKVGKWKQGRADREVGSRNNSGFF